MAHQVAKIKLTKLLAKNHLTAWKENQLTLTICSVATAENEGDIVYI